MTQRWAHSDFAAWGLCDIGPVHRRGDVQQCARPGFGGISKSKALSRCRFAVDLSPATCAKVCSPGWHLNFAATAANAGSQLLGVGFGKFRYSGKRQVGLVRGRNRKSRPLSTTSDPSFAGLVWAKRACASPSEAMVSQKCISCGRLGVRRQEMQRHARMLIQRGLVAEANKPRCLRCVQKLLSGVGRAALQKEIAK